MYIDKLLNYGKKKLPVRSKYPTFNRRMLAVTIDSLFLMVFLPLINRLAPVHTEAVENYSVDPKDPRAGSHFLMHILSNQAFLESWFSNFLMQMLFWCVYSAIFLHFWSATPGKMLLRMKVVDAKTGGRINDLQVFLRSFGYLISTVAFCLGFLWINFNERKRGWHDYLADTVVINLPLLPWKKLLKTTELPPVAESEPPNQDTL